MKGGIVLLIVAFLGCTFAVKLNCVQQKAKIARNAQCPPALGHKYNVTPCYELCMKQPPKSADECGKGKFAHCCIYNCACVVKGAGTEEGEIPVRFRIKEASVPKKAAQARTDDRPFVMEEDCTPETTTTKATTTTKPRGRRPKPGKKIPKPTTIGRKPTPKSPKPRPKSPKPTPKGSKRRNNQQRRITTTRRTRTTTRRATTSKKRQKPTTKRTRTTTCSDFSVGFGNIFARLLSGIGFSAESGC